MMTYGQLSELFRRLDLSGDGELDLEEFCNIRNKIKLDVEESFLVRFVFSLHTDSPNATVNSCI